MTERGPFNPLGLVELLMGPTRTVSYDAGLTPAAHHFIDVRDPASGATVVVEWKGSNPEAWGVTRITEETTPFDPPDFCCGSLESTVAKALELLPAPPTQTP